MFLRSFAVMLMSLLASQLAFAQGQPKLLVREATISPSSAQVTAEVADGAVTVTIEPGNEGYPGITLKPAAGGLWDLSEYGYVEAHITNLTDTPITVGIRVDDNGDWRTSPWNSENLYLKANASGSKRVYFGMSYGKKGHDLKTNSVSQVLLFGTKKAQKQAFRIDLLQAGGVTGERPPVNPDSVRTKPENGVIFGKGVEVDVAKQITTKNATATVTPSGLQVKLAANKSDAQAALKPAIGRWDLRDFLEVKVAVKNDGTSPVTPRVSLRSNSGPTDTITGSPLAPGESAVLTVPFASKSLWNGEKDSGNRFANDTGAAVVISAENSADERVLTVESIVAGVPELQLPEWLGKRPPVEGDWVLTFEDNFDGDSVDTTKWNYYGANYWDKRTHFSRDNVIVGDGVVRLRAEKKRGKHNDDPESERETDYATGFLDTYGKWRQKYGYFEARQKVPTAPGLWPAFWMMPDRGPEVGPQWKRQDTKNGGMEIDIYEYLTRWGRYRYNIALHWDGYNKDHKAIGSTLVYGQPDKDGFFTAGVLWLPGQIVFYFNGQEVGRWENERVCNVPMNLIFTLPTGGWDNSPLDDSKLPDDYIVDYVRVWQRKDLASEEDGYMPGGKDYDGRDRR